MHLPLVTPATPKDLGELIRVARAAYCETYEPIGDKPEGIVRIYANTEFTREKLLPCIRTPDENSPRYYTGRYHGELAGYASMQKAATPACVPDSNSIYFSGVMVLSRFQGLGLGRKFFETRRDGARQRGFTGAWLSVWSLNTTAISFHHRMGFKIVGHQQWRYEAEGKLWLCDDLVMFKPL